MGNSPGNWDWQSNLRDIASGGHNVGDIVNGWRWDGVGWHQEGGGGGGGGGSTGGGGNGDAVFGAAKTALTDRYDKLIQQIQGNQTQATNEQTLTTKNQLAARGISSTEGMGQQAMTDSLGKVRNDYTGQLNTANGQFNTDIANLAISQYTGQQTAAQNAIQNAISQGQLNNQTRQTDYDVNKPYAQGSSSSSSSSTDIPVGGGLGFQQQPAAKSWVNATTGATWDNPSKTPVGKLADGRTLYSDGTKGWGQWNYQ